MQTETTRPPLNENLIKVSSKSRSTAVAGAIAAVIRNSRQAEVQAIGAGAVNQAVKALAIASTYLEEDQIRIANTIYFIDIEINGEERTAVRFSVMTLP
ncbi:MAG: stage V sporulation protein S [Anaerolineaceae bacterium]|nr:stage V sporulation protein S [Anaerolineaceae bacterium]MCY3935811.1 stage V sporulation protein S [Chloroflexota bacterium]MCY4010438.1 stage V sporulation protein S [Anaerolineaceae bacterium]MCY4106912.1 stage V sporulation protein S [Chloroflexota bacterium]